MKISKSELESFNRPAMLIKGELKCYSNCDKEDKGDFFELTRINKNEHGWAVITANVEGCQEDTIVKNIYF